ncbi:hypothetical protein I305_02586 [Cryptococcus gattii E566]|uniref:Uncharacterized protein n=1 Tax=Cryptococcus gattii serotype B (strain WM276 / ATCC MYA-4071) TaxID=367775 RepID=E6RAV7_CRYGW|nr:Hypothetical Protein CGB_H3190C [Cryptococcus gattii WM276]ADV24016.1 Hypothetical Protein CGB_H3190C [Cryptococcus gattii WM276]KIY35021.1 hypothetical protein I305_02586 [Cryptococcus gattii E566]
MGRDGNFPDSNGTEDGATQSQPMQQSHANSQSLWGGKSLEARAHQSTPSVSSTISGSIVMHEDTFGTKTKHVQSLYPSNDLRPKASDNTSIAGDDSNSSRPSRRPLANISETVNRTPTSAGMASEFSTPAELSFGPQSLPFMLRKRELVNQGTPSKPTSTATTTSLSKDPIGPSAGIQFSGRQQLILDHHNESHETHRSSVDQGTNLPHSSVDHANKQSPEKKLTSWRRDQIKKAKQPELILTSTLRPIPTLYGPLSLPYARNPSGVDATVPDDSAYISRVFGLRPASGGVSSMVGAESVRSISSATQSSSVQSFRSTSGSSLLYSTGKKVQDTKLINEDSASTGNKRVVSDTELLERKLGTSVIGPSKSHANLRQLIALSPIPGSPVGFQRKPDITAIRKACKARIRSASMSRVEPTVTLSEEDYTSSYATPIRIPAFLPVFFNRSSMTYEIDISPDKAISRARVPGPQTVYVKPDSSQFSKADVSDNWRYKPRSQVFRSKQPLLPSRTLNQSPSARPLYTDLARHDRVGQIMTIDKLFEKFSPQASGIFASIAFLADLNPQVEKTQVSSKSPTMEELSSPDSTSLARPDLSPTPSEVV